MKYIQPFGISDPDGSYVNGDPSIGREGSIPPAAVFEHPEREIVNTILKSMINPDGGDLYQLTKAVRSQRLNFADDTGSVNAFSCALDPPLTSYQVGFPIHLRVANTNTGPCTLNAGAGAASVIYPNGAAPASGDIDAGAVLGVIWDGTHWQILNFGGTGGEQTIINVRIPYAVDTSVTPNTLTTSFSPAITSLTAGDVILVQINNTMVTGAATITINALGPYPIKIIGTTIGTTPGDPLQGDALKYDLLFMRWDGTNWWIDPNPTITANTTLTVPGMFANVNAAVAALRRKVITPEVAVTIQIAGGSSGSPYVTAPFAVYHANADRIVIRGTMLAAAPVIGNFAANGASQGQMEADATTNLAMLRTRYGTEVQVSNAVAVQNKGPGQPQIMDLLLVSVGGGGYGIALDLEIGVSQHIFCTNVACWGMTFGYIGGGRGRMNSCIANACTIGWSSQNGGMMGGSGNIAVGCFDHGYDAINNSTQIWDSTTAYFCGELGFYVGDHSYMSCNGCASTGNGVYDLSVGTLSEMQIVSQTYVTSSPAVGTFSDHYGYLAG